MQTRIGESTTIIVISKVKIYIMKLGAHGTENRAKRREEIGIYYLVSICFTFLFRAGNIYLIQNILHMDNPLDVSTTNI